MGSICTRQSVFDVFRFRSLYIVEGPTVSTTFGRLLQMGDPSVRDTNCSTSRPCIPRRGQASVLRRMTYEQMNERFGPALGDLSLDFPRAAVEFSLKQGLLVDRGLGCPRTRATCAARQLAARSRTEVPRSDSRVARL